MHESSLAKQILDAALARAHEHGARRVRRIRGWIAETEALSRHGIEFHFAAHARGTPAEGAELMLRLIHVEARCRACGRTYVPEHHLVLCPSCLSTDGELMGETGLGIDALEVD